MSRGYLLVQAEGTSYGLPLGQVLQVGDLGAVLEVPRVLPAMRGLTQHGDHLVPLVHLAALLADRTPPDKRGRASVIVDFGGKRVVALEVDDAYEVVRDPVLPVPPGESLPWASGVARREGRLVPILDWNALEERIR